MKTELIRALAKQLRLPTLSRVEEAIREAEEKHWPYDEFLCFLLSQEVAQRQENQLQRKTLAARFPLSKGLDTFQLKRLPNVEEAVVWQLAAGDFVKRQENVILIGNPGTGKTHLAIGLGRRLCREGYRVRFFTAAQLVIELEEAQNANLAPRAAEGRMHQVVVLHPPERHRDRGHAIDTLFVATPASHTGCKNEDIVSKRLEFPGECVHGNHEAAEVGFVAVDEKGDAQAINSCRLDGLSEATEACDAVEDLRFLQAE